MDAILAAARAERLFRGDSGLHLPALLRGLPRDIPLSVQVPTQAPALPVGANRARAPGAGGTRAVPARPDAVAPQMRDAGDTLSTNPRETRVTPTVADRSNPGPERLRIAIVGAGAIGRSHAALVAANPGCTLSAIVDPAPAAAALAKTAGVPWFRTLAELLAADPPDGVVIATPNQLHVEQALACIEANVAALVEKPIAHTVEAAGRLCRAVDAAGARVLIGHHRAHSPILAEARRLIRQGRLGAVVAVSESAMFYKPDRYFAEAPWRRQAGGGPILINLIHEIGNLRGLCGEIVAVQAFGSSATRGFEVEDTAAIALRFASGALGTFVLSDTAASARSWEQTSQENQAYANYVDEDCYLVAGTWGSLAIPTMRLKTYGRPDSRSWFEPFDSAISAVERRDPLALQLEHFCAVARGTTAPLVSARDGLQNLRVVEAIGEAVRVGRVVEIDGLDAADRS